MTEGILMTHVRPF